MADYRNARVAFLGELRGLLTAGSLIEVRGKLTRERIARSITLTSPEERTITVPGRGNSLVAAIAETVWVLAGRSDIAYLTPYLKRAPEFSDDGVSWRAGYGPRLRDWNGLDQLHQVLNLLENDPTSRQGVMVIFDPDRDWQSSLDIPCNNWLQFLLRDGRLHMLVSVRSNDLWWGFSGINTFEWSVLQTAMAHWLDAQVGEVTYTVGSLHLYERHFELAGKVLTSDHLLEQYERVRPSPFSTPFAEFDGLLSKWFGLESQLRAGEDPLATITSFPDPLLRDFLLAVRAWWIRRHDGSRSAVREAVDLLRDTDLFDGLQLQLLPLPAE